MRRLGFYKIAQSTLHILLILLLVPGISLAAPERDGLEGFGNFAKEKPVSQPQTTSEARQRARGRFSGKDSIEGFGDYATNPQTSLPVILPPSPTQTPLPTPSPKPKPSEDPSSGSLGFLNSLLGGAIGQALSGSGLGQGLGGMLGGGNSQGWGGPDSWGGTSSDGKYGQRMDYTDQLLQQIKQQEGEQRPGSSERKVDGEQCELGPGYFSDRPEGTLLGPGDYVGAAHGNGGQFGDGAYRSIAQKTGATYQSFSKGGAGTREMLGVLKNAGRGDTMNPLTGKKQNVVIFFNCHGGGDYLEGTGGGITGRDMANSILAGGKETGNKDFSHITIVDGGCMPCRGNNMQSQFESADAEKSINYFSGASPDRFAWTSGGSGHISQQILQGLQGRGPGASILKSDLINAVRRVGNGAYFHRSANFFEVEER